MISKIISNLKTSIKIKKIGQKFLELSVPFIKYNNFQKKFLFK